MKIIVTGAAGFIGSHLCESLVKREYEVFGIDNFDDYYSRSQKEKNLEFLNTNSNFHFFELDIRNRRKILDFFSKIKPDRVAHLAGKAGVRYSIDRSSLYYDNNVMGTISLLDAACKCNVGIFVFASTSSVYGNTNHLPFEETLQSDRPLAPYPATKRSCEMLGHSYSNLHNLNFTALRLFSVYGPRGRPDMMPYTLINSLFTNKEITVFGDGEMKRDWTYVDDVVSGFCLALENPLGYEIINIGKGKPISLMNVIKYLEKLLGKKANIKKCKTPKTEPRITYANINKASELISYCPATDFEEGYSKMVDWYIKNTN